jgi:hypothetical protein
MAAAINFSLLFSTKSNGSAHTCEGGGVSESAHLRVGQSGEKGNDVVHEVLVVDDRVLTLLHKQLHKLAEVGAEFLPLLPSHCQRVLATFLFLNHF